MSSCVKDLFPFIEKDTFVNNLICQTFIPDVFNNNIVHNANPDPAVVSSHFSQVAESRLASSATGTDGDNYQIQPVSGTIPRLRRSRRLADLVRSFNDEIT